jgi:hypothetical protein
MKNLADNKVIVTYAGKDSIWAAFALIDDAEEFARSVAHAEKSWKVRVEFSKKSKRGTRRYE